jgi:hypothetical protein
VVLESISDLGGREKQLKFAKIDCL